MTPHHTSDDDLILHFYGESPDTGAIDRHLAVCAECRRNYDTMRDVLALVDRADAFTPAETPGPAFERQMWARLEPQLPARPESWLSRLFPTTQKWALAGAVAALLVLAFVAGRLTTNAPAVPDVVVADSAPPLAERVLVVAVVDHLDRSQMVLMEVLNADVESAGELSVEQSLARELVAANRLYRRTAVQTGNGSAHEVLDELERVLLEIANTPQDATREDLDVLRARISSGGLLFKVRVVHADMLERERQTLLPGSQS